ncbi:hypothetical protein SISI_0077 [Candidatus Portiera aleyrodidarum]|uniref:Uncharacterized protein n=1 Tax=Candidatus Portiera aleyrodidarum TaxID=91844 RepID=A0A6S6RVS5_9GAMM|nr:hypothetical protein SISI_0077 [Candidatus Portiera aleyrodidarum]
MLRYYENDKLQLIKIKLKSLYDSFSKVKEYF